MNIIVITSKHHDGFGMFRSDQTDWCIKSTPFPARTRSRSWPTPAGAAGGIRLLLYHSIMDWQTIRLGHALARGMTRPPARRDMDRYTAYMKASSRNSSPATAPLGILWVRR